MGGGDQLREWVRHHQRRCTYHSLCVGIGDCERVETRGRSAMGSDADSVLGRECRVEGRLG